MMQETTEIEFLRKSAMNEDEYVFNVFYDFMFKPRLSLMEFKEFVLKYFAEDKRNIILDSINQVIRNWYLLGTELSQVTDRDTAKTVFSQRFLRVTQIYYYPHQKMGKECKYRLTFQLEDCTNNLLFSSLESIYNHLILREVICQLWCVLKEHSAKLSCTMERRRIVGSVLICDGTYLSHHNYANDRHNCNSYSCNCCFNSTFDVAQTSYYSDLALIGLRFRGSVTS